MKSIKFSAYLIAFLFSIIQVAGQHLKAAPELEKINLKYQNIKAWSSQIVYRSYQEGSKDPVDVKVGFYAKDARGSLYSLSGINIITSDKYILNAVENRKTLIISKNKKKVDNIFSNMSLDSILLKNTRSSVRKETDSTNRLSIILNKSVANTIESIDIIYNSKLYTISKIFMNYGSKNLKFTSDQSARAKLEMSFRNFVEKASINWSEYELTKIFKKEKSVLKGLGQYKAYTIIDNRFK